MEPIIIRFAQLYSSEFMERLGIGSLHGDLTPDEINKARELWDVSSSMLDIEVVNMRSLAIAMHVAGLDKETGLYDAPKVQSLTLYLAEKSSDIKELQFIAAETLSIINRYELQQACYSRSGGAE